MRDERIMALRPELKLNFDNSSELEKFQNITLRPILKLQHPITLSLLYSSKHFSQGLKTVNQKKLTELNDFIKRYLSNDKNLRHKILGIIIGMMTEQEYSFYLDNESEFNKRIMSMQIKRYADTISKRW